MNPGKTEDKERRGAVVITGASVGLGRAIANTIVKDGYDSRRVSRVSKKEKQPVGALPGEYGAHALFGEKETNFTPYCEQAYTKNKFFLRPWQPEAFSKSELSLTITATPGKSTAHCFKFLNT